ncbi:low molecular weight protein-tyrosine-phosphatase [Methylobrevis pamukkalensis]|uniref:protein-tyrosine-phosphatase n=1 Tax=Methylobrevis pamukkalensis TaxID=1439726 RepID=A0A1E3H1U8_9HYPH|nr:low molecular weight protein-tyrosine-phosphatase [Methylobrevis pamukkalensis]ODN70290.1 Low molecular weight protein-tyrosine-phosphatase YfkJ [Methylobrevis pamukkalensis]
MPDLPNEPFPAKPTRSVLFVCLGNICRSPLAEGFLRAALGGVDAHLASAGTGGWHAGDPPDARAIRAAADFGVDISAQRARQVCLEDFRTFDLILGMDRANVDDLRKLAPPDATARIALFREDLLGEARDVPDPYYGTPRDFAIVADLCRRGAAALAARIQAASNG